ncbi:MAG: radical SAM protein [Lentisphaeria bacterium]
MPHPPAITPKPPTGIVFDIREFTVHDGPGMRTTVFLKGCPLRCAWCHNPEGWTHEPEVMRSPQGERLVGREYGAGELATLLNRLAPVLRGVGGVTFSGGEPLMQAAFVTAVMERLEGLHVALQTSGFAPAAEFRRVAAQADLILLDLKLIDPAAHRRWTGVDNAPILANLAQLRDLPVPFTVRIPLVPGVTDTAANLRGIAAALRGFPRLQGVELMPYNRAAGGKYAACGRCWEPAWDETRPSQPDLSPFLEETIHACVL